MRKKSELSPEEKAKQIETGKRIKAAIKQQHLKQYNVAKDVGHTPQWFNKICSGRAKLQTDTAKQLAEYLKVDWLWLIGESDYPNEMDRRAAVLAASRRDVEEFIDEAERSWHEEQGILSILSRHGIRIEPYPKDDNYVACSIDGQELLCPEALYNAAVLSDIYAYIEKSAERFKELIRIYNK